MATMESSWNQKVPRPNENNNGDDGFNFVTASIASHGEETAYEPSEPKKKPPQDFDSESKGQNGA